jgi:hypothetical protein
MTVATTMCAPCTGYCQSCTSTMPCWS